MENIFLESYDVFKVSNNSGKAYADFLEKNKRYQITRCYYIIVVDNVFLTYSHLMLYEQCLYLLYSQNKLQNSDFSLSIKKSELAKRFKTDITKGGATKVVKRFYEMQDVKITIFVKDQIEKQMNIIEFIDIPETEKYSDLPDEVAIRLNPEFVKLYRCAYLDKIEYLNSFSVEQGSFVRYFMQHELDGGVKSSAILDKMGIFEYTPFSRKKRFEQEVSNLQFFYKNEEFYVKDGFVVAKGDAVKVNDNQNAAIKLFETIYKKVSENLSRHIMIDEQSLQGYYERFGKFQTPTVLFKMLSNLELMLNQSLQQETNEVAFFSHFFESVVCKKDIEMKIYIELSLKGFEYILSRRANLDLYNVESSDYGLTPYPAPSCAI